MIKRKSYRILILFLSVLPLLILPNACEKSEENPAKLKAALIIDSLTYSDVYGRVIESVDKIDFYLREKNRNDSLLGTWTNPSPKQNSADISPFNFTFDLKRPEKRGLFILADIGSKQAQKELFPPKIWVSSLYINHIVTEDALKRIWPEGASGTSGIKAWDGKINYLDISTLKNWENSLRKRNMKLSFEKGRWPLPPDLYELQVNKEIDKLISKGDNRGRELLRHEAEQNILRDRGEMLSTDDYQFLYSERIEFITKAAAPDIERLKKIRDAGMLDLFESIEYDGSVIKNVFPYTTAMTQWQLDVPESDRFKPGFGSVEQFLDVFSDMVRYIKVQLGPEADHIEFRILCNFHFWTYGEPVMPEQKPDGSWVYHNVSFHRFREHTLDFKDVVEYIKDKKDLIGGITTDFPYELYKQTSANQRYRRMVSDLKRYKISLRPIVTAMSANNSMIQYHQDILSFFRLLENEVSPDMYMIQSWGTHPTVKEVKESEDSFGSWLNAVKSIISDFQ